MARISPLSVGHKDVLEHLLGSRPEARDRLQPYVRRAKAYRNECGCAMSGAFLVTALFLVLILGLRGYSPFQAGILAQVIMAAAFVLAAGLTGKLAGIAIARIRLSLLYRDLRYQFALDGG